MNDLYNIDQNLPQYNEKLLTEILILGKNDFSHQKNLLIITLSINYILKSARFDGPLI